jgi:hypothetical protein
MSMGMSRSIMSNNMAVESFPPDSETAARLRFAGITWVGLRHLLFLGIKKHQTCKSLVQRYLLSSL